MKLMEKRKAFMFIIVVFAWGMMMSHSEEKDRGSSFSSIQEATRAIANGAQTEGEKLERIFYFVRDEITFNWIFPQDIPAEEVLFNGYGVCMQKAHLFSAMARKAGLQTRFRFEFVNKQALEDFLPSYAYKNWQDPFPHTVTEVFLNNKWVSFDPSFDQKLYDLCIKKRINFARYPEIKNAYTTDFSLEGMKGTQEFWRDTSQKAFYGETLSPLIEWDKENVSFIKRAFKPKIFRDSKKIMDTLRQ